jgi:carbon-monoxide dehydrogenase medium subunit
MRRYHYPFSLVDACERLASADGDAIVYGGGTAVQIRLNQGAPVPDDVVDLGNVPGLTDLTATPEGLRIGALVTLRRLETDPLVRASAPLLAEVCRQAANPRVRNTATIGGNLAQAEPSFDPPLALLVLGATVEVASIDGTRTVPMRQFTLDRRDIVTAINVPGQAGIGRFVKFSGLAANDRASASAATVILSDRLRIAVGAVSAKPVYRELDPTDDVWAAVEPRLDPVADLRGGVEYKKRLARVAIEEVLGGRR